MQSENLSRSVGEAMKVDEEVLNTTAVGNFAKNKFPQDEDDIPQLSMLPKFSIKRTTRLETKQKAG